MKITLKGNKEIKDTMETLTTCLAIIKNGKLEIQNLGHENIRLEIKNEELIIKSCSFESSEVESLLNRIEEIKQDKNRIEDIIEYYQTR